MLPTAQYLDSMGFPQLADGVDQSTTQEAGRSRNGRSAKILGNFLEGTSRDTERAFARIAMVSDTNGSAMRGATSNSWGQGYAYDGFGNLLDQSGDRRYSSDP